MITLEDLLDKVSTKTASLYCEIGGRVWSLHPTDDDGSLVLSREESKISIVNKEPRDFDCLTAREREVIGLVLEGYTYRYISQQLFISEGTVKKTVHNAYVKLRVSSRIELIGKIL